MVIVDQYYIINLPKNHLRKRNCLRQLKACGIENYRIMNAVNSHDEAYTGLYNELVSTMSPAFVKHNFQRGALGCLLSHLACIQDAKDHHYQHIVILEDDFLFKNNYASELNVLSDHLDTRLRDWDFVYLGKKQGTVHMKMQTVEQIHSHQEYFQIQDIDDVLYRPNYKTWATHALLVRCTIFDEILGYRNKIMGAIDLMLMTSYPKYTFACLKQDLVISTDDSSDIDVQLRQVNWGWKKNLYMTVKERSIRFIVILGFKTGHHTHHYIHKMYYRFFGYYYPELSVHWVNTVEQMDNLRKHVNFEEAIVFLSPCHQKLYKSLPAKAFYIVHLDEFDNSGYKSIGEFFRSEIGKPILEAKQYIVLTCRENIQGLRYFEKSTPHKMICMPWFSDILYEDLNKYKTNARAIYDRNEEKKYICFMGSIWGINIGLIRQLIDICERNEIYLLLKGRVFGIPDADKLFLENLKNTHRYVKLVSFVYVNSTENAENTLDYLNIKYGVRALLPLQGDDHNHNYISNRIFETISNGYLVVSNNALVKQYYASAIYEEDIERLLLRYIELLKNKDAWVRIYLQQLDEFVDKFYGYHNIHRLVSFLQETCRQSDDIILDLHCTVPETGPRKLQLVTNGEGVVKSNELLRQAIRQATGDLDISINLDPFLLERIQSLPSYSLVLEK